MYGLLSGLQTSAAVGLRQPVGILLVFVFAIVLLLGVGVLVFVFMLRMILPPRLLCKHVRLS